MRVHHFAVGLKAAGREDDGIGRNCPCPAGVRRDDPADAAVPRRDDSFAQDTRIA